MAHIVRATGAENKNPEALLSKKYLMPESKIAARPPLRGIQEKSTRPKSSLSHQPDVQPKVTSKRQVGDNVLHCLRNRIILAEAKKVLNKKDMAVLEVRDCNDEVEPMDISLKDSFSTSMLPLGVSNIDDTKGNPNLCGMYAMDVFKYLRKLESEIPIGGCHLSQQEDITSKMRSILVDWLVQVHHRFGFIVETLHLTVSTIDRFLEKRKFNRNKLQLIGISSLYLAAKYEEIYIPDINDFVIVTDSSCTRKDILKMEIEILKTLDFKMGRPLPIHFLRRCSKAADCEVTTHILAKYIVELSFIESCFCSCSPSLLAAASAYISFKLLDNLEWGSQMVYYSSYTEEDLAPVVQRLSALLLKAPTYKYQAVRGKYSHRNQKKVSALPVLYSSNLIKMSKAPQLETS